MSTCLGSSSIKTVNFKTILASLQETGIFLCQDFHMGTGLTVVGKVVVFPKNTF